MRFADFSTYLTVFSFDNYDFHVCVLNLSVYLQKLSLKTSILYVTEIELFFCTEN